MRAKREAYLIKCCAKNDRKAQREIYEYYFAMMYAVCKRYVKRDEEAMGALNMAMLAVFKNIHTFSFQGSFEGWVRRIVINQCLDLLRSQKRYNATMKLEEDMSQLSLSVVRNEAESSWSTEELYASIRELPDVTQAVFNLFVIEGFSHQEIGKKLNIKEGTSRWHLARARELLQEILKKKESIKERAYG